MCDHCGCRQFPAIADLSAEHEEILRVAWRVCEGTAGPTGADPADRDALLSMLAVHVEAEETALYPLLVRNGDLAPEQSDRLAGEHDDVTAALRNGTFDRRAYYELAAHIEEEEMELFPSAMFGFDDEDWQRMAAAPRFIDTGSRTATVAS